MKLIKFDKTHLHNKKTKTMIKGQFIKHTDELLFKDEDGHYWFGTPSKYDNTNEPIYIYFEKRDMVVRDKKPKIYLEDEAFFSSLTITTFGSKYKLVNNTLQGIWGSKQNYLNRKNPSII
jgi:hypothetical protein